MSALHVLHAEHDARRVFTGVDRSENTNARGYTISCISQKKHLGGAFSVWPDPLMVLRYHHGGQLLSLQQYLGDLHPCNWCINTAFSDARYKNHTMLHTNRYMGAFVLYFESSQSIEIRDSSVNYIFTKGVPT